MAEPYVPPRRIMDLREMVRYRADLVRIRTSLKNRIHAYLLMHGLRLEGTPFSKDYAASLRQIHDYRIDGYLNLIEALNREITQVSRMITAEAKDDEYARLLTTIPGVGYYSALLIVSEIGEIERWGAVGCVGFSGFACEVLEASFLVSVPPIVECSSRNLDGGAYLADRNPVPPCSDTPMPKLENVSCRLHAGTPPFLVLNMCARCDVITDVPPPRLKEF
jgi:hypothetical protein